MTQDQNVIRLCVNFLKNRFLLDIIIRMKEFKIFDKLLNLIYPEKCPYCGDIIKSEYTKCEECEKNVKSVVTVRNITNDCYCITPFIYEGVVKDAIWKFKFRNCARFSRNFGFEILKAITSKFPSIKFSGITYVPLSPQKISQRGYNQSELLAKIISQKLNIPILDLLKKIKDNPSQHTLGNTEIRAINVKGVYEHKFCCGRCDKSIILCDDIVTSGNTMKECVRTLNKAGFENIVCVAIASVKLTHM